MTVAEPPLPSSYATSYLSDKIVDGRSSEDRMKVYSGVSKLVACQRNIGMTHGGLLRWVEIFSSQTQLGCHGLVTYVSPSESAFRSTTTH